MEIVKCESCPDPQACRNIFSRTVRHENMITQIIGGPSNLTPEEVLDRNAIEIQGPRIDISHKLRNMGCSLTAAEIDQNIALLKG